MCKAMEDMITDFVTDEKKLAAIRVLEGGKLTQEEIAEDLMKKYNIEPLVTISHYETPFGLTEKWNGWLGRETIDCYLRYCETIFNRYKDVVKYWLTFNEINSALHAPFMSAGIMRPKEELSKQDLYQAMHHELVASALAVKIRPEINPEFKIGQVARADCGGADHDGTGERAAADLVEADDHVVAGGRDRPFHIQRGHYGNGHQSADPSGTSLNTS